LERLTDMTNLAVKATSLDFFHAQIKARGISIVTGCYARNYGRPTVTQNKFQLSPCHHPH
jgi:hypothetical protein